MIYRKTENNAASPAVTLAGKPHWRWSPVAALCLCLASSWPVAAQSARFDGEILSLQSVAAEGKVYAVELELLADSFPARFRLLSAEEVMPAELFDAVLAEGVLSVVSIDVAGTPHWAQLGLVSREPVLFELLSGGVDDEDDDNDGQPDLFDDMPWTPSLCTSPACLREPPSTGPDPYAFIDGYTGHFRYPTINWPGISP